LYDLLNAVFMFPFAFCVINYKSIQMSAVVNN